MHSIRFGRFSGFVCCALLGLTHSSWGQGVSVGRDGITLSGFPAPDMAKTGEAWADQQRGEFETLMNLQIDMIDRDCSLTPQQVRKLRVATKGVLDKRIQIGLKRIRQFSVAAGLLPLPEGEKIENPRPDKIQEEDGPDGLRIRGARTIDQDVILFFTEHPVSITDHPMWDTIITKTLTAEQLQRYRSASKVRNGFLLRNAIGNWSSQLDNQLYLSKPQRDAVIQKVNDSLQPKVTHVFPDDVDEAEKMLEDNIGELESLIESILTPKQVERWQQQRKGRPGPSVGWG